MREQPNPVELLESVAAFLREELGPTLMGRPAFLTRVAANVLDIVGRELTLGPGAEARERARLAALIGRDADVEALTAALCDRIAAGEIAEDDPALIDHLWGTTLDTMAIDQPAYATYRRATGETAPDGA
jgi:hypothetical protein